MTIADPYSLERPWIRGDPPQPVPTGSEAAEARDAPVFVDDSPVSVQDSDEPSQASSANGAAPGPSRAAGSAGSSVSLGDTHVWRDGS